MPDARPPYRLVVLDFDGTLADSFDWFARVINDVADRYRFRRIEPGETERLRGLSAREIVRHLGIPGWKLPFIARHMHALAARDIAEMSLFPGIAAMLAGLGGAGLTLAILSSNTEANVRRVLGPSRAAGIRHYACGASIFGKAGRLRALVRASGVAPEAVLAIGDEIRDHEAAQEAGCDFGAVAWGYTRTEALAARRPAFLFQCPADVTRALLQSS